MKTLLKLVAAGSVIAMMSGCAFIPFDPMTKPDEQPSHDYVSLTNYDRIGINKEEPIKIRVIASSKDKVPQNFDLNKLHTEIEKRMTHEGFKISNTGTEIIVDLKEYGFKGKALIRRNGGNLVGSIGGSLFGAGLATAGQVLAGSAAVGAIDGVTQKGTKNALGFVLEITVPAESYETEVKVLDKYEAFNPIETAYGRDYEKIAKIVFELLS